MMFFVKPVLLIPLKGAGTGDTGVNQPGLVLGDSSSGRGRRTQVNAQTYIVSDSETG